MGPPKWLALSALAKVLHDQTHDPSFTTVYLAKKTECQEY